MTMTPAKKPTAAKPAAPKPASKVLEAATRPVEVVGQTLERAFDPLTSALKRAALKRADRQAAQFAAAAPASAKDAMPVSPLAVPFPQMPPIAGVQMATARAGFYKHERDDLLEKLRGRSKVEVLVKTESPAQAVPPADAPKSGVSPALTAPAAPALRGLRK